MHQCMYKFLCHNAFNDKIYSKQLTEYNESSHEADLSDLTRANFVPSQGWR